MIEVIIKMVKYGNTSYYFKGDDIVYHTYDPGEASNLQSLPKYQVYGNYGQSDSNDPILRYKPGRQKIDEEFNLTKDLDNEMKPKQRFDTLEFVGTIHIIYLANNNNIYELRWVPLLSFFTGWRFNLLIKGVDVEPKTFYKGILNRRRLKCADKQLEFDGIKGGWLNENGKVGSEIKRITNCY